MESFVCRPYPVPENEEKRIRVLQECNILDSSTYEVDFDRFTSLARRIFRVPIALVSLVDVDRQWFKSNMGLTVFETAREFSFCAHAIVQEVEEVFIVLDATNDDRFKNNPLVTGSPFIRFYAGGTIMIDDCRIGSFCIIDSEVHSEFTLNDKMNLMDLAEAVACLIRQRRDIYLKQQTEKQDVLQNLINELKAPLGHLNRGLSMLTSGTESTACEVEGGPTLLNSLETSLSALNIVVDGGLQKLQLQNFLATPETEIVQKSPRYEIHMVEPQLQLQSTAPSENEIEILQKSESVSSILEAGTPTTAVNQPPKVRVLVMDDSPIVQKLLSRWFSTHGCDVVVAANGMIGLIAMKTERFDLVLIDFLMPVMDGVECMQEYRVHRKIHEQCVTMNYNKNMLIIGMSATASKTEQAQAFKNGMHAFTPKPVDLTLLQLAVNLKKNKTDLMACSDALHSHFSCGFIFEDLGSYSISRINSEDEYNEGQDKSTSDVVKKTIPYKKKSFFGEWSFTGSSTSKAKIFPK